MTSVAIMNEVINAYGEDFMMTEQVAEVDYCVCCGEEATMNTDKGTPVCPMCWFDQRTKERTQEWYEAGEVLSEPHKYVVFGEKGTENLILTAKDMDDVERILKSQYKETHFFGANVVELNEYRMVDGKYSWGPRTSFMMLAVREYYEQTGEEI